MILYKAEKHFAWMQKLQTSVLKCFSPEVREATDIIFSVMVIFMITCIGSMLIICFFFEMDRRSSTAPAQQALPNAADAPAR